MCAYEILNYKNENVKTIHAWPSGQSRAAAVKNIRTACYPIGTRVRSRLTGHFTADTLTLYNVYINPSKCWKLIKYTLFSELYIMCVLWWPFISICLPTRVIFLKKCKKNTSDQFYRLVFILHFWITFRETSNRKKFTSDGH